MKYLSVLIMVLIFPLYACATVSLKVNKGVKGAVPLAVYPFIWQGQQKKAPIDMASVVANDLQNSGKFQIFSNPAPPQAVGQVNLAAWRERKVNAVLSGQLSAEGNGQYQVHFQLINVFKQPGEQSQTSNAVFGVDSGTVLAEGEFQIQTKNLRQTAHQISNQIFQKLIGIDGVFTTHLAYVQIKKVNNRLQYQLMTADYDGFNPQMIYSSPQPILTPTWSPDGSQVAFVAYQNGHTSVYIDTLSDKSLRLVSNVNGLNSAPQFGPEGKNLFVSLSKGRGINIFEINLQTGKLTQITHGLAISTSPALSADGKTLYFTSTRGGSAQIYDKNLKSRVGVRLSFSGDENMSPVISNNVIVYLQRQGKNYQEVMQTQNGVLPISAKGLVYPGSLSPAALMLVYPMIYQGQRHFLLTTLASGQQHFLPIVGDVRYPAWSQQ